MERDLRREKIRIQVLNTIEKKEHFHQDIELIYVLEGRMQIEVAGQETNLEPEDILVINANKKHRFQASGDILFARLNIEYKLISDIFQSVDIMFWCDSTKTKQDGMDELRKVLKDLLNHYLSTQGGVVNFGHIALCYQVMDILSVHFLVRASDKENMTEQDRFEERILQINNYIRANYSQVISLKDLSERLFLSDGYLSRFFKKTYGMSFAEYLTNIRLYHAVDELLYSNNAVTRIAYNNGFTSVAMFNKSFKKAYGETPSVMRRKHQEQKMKVEDQHKKKELEDRLEHFLREDGVPHENIVAGTKIRETHSVNGREPLSTFWNHLINVGSAEDLLRSEVREHIVLLREVLNFTYVRFWNIFSPDLLIDIKRDNADYNFSRLDSIIDFLLQQGMKPHIELGQKPRRIQRGIHDALVMETDMILFESIKQWDQVIDALMRHMLQRYGRQEIDSWRIEIWYDERYPESETTICDYFELFEHVYDIVRKYSGRLKIGGCGMWTDGVEAKKKFLQQWSKHKNQPDFLSVLHYAYVQEEVDGERYSRRSTDTSSLLHGIEMIKRTMKEVGWADVKLSITEWNLTISDRNYINDTCFKGAYLVKNLLDIYGQVDEIGYFLGSDCVSEYYDSNALLHGGGGLFTKDGILKPAGYAYEFMNRLLPYYVGRGENYFITMDGHHSYGIICHNMKKLNYNYYFIKEDEVQKEHIWKYFEDRNKLNLHLQLSDIKDGSYQIKFYRINEQNGSVFDIWAEMEYEKELSKNDVKYLWKVCEPRLSIQKCEVEGGKVTLDMELKANEILFVRMNKISSFVAF